ncbi:hypothetical protein IWZ01DRAFT_540450 [Phyllosticta capitalensis]
MESSFYRAGTSTLAEHPRPSTEPLAGHEDPALGQAIPKSLVHQKPNNPDMNSRVRLAREILETDDLQAVLARMTLSDDLHIQAALARMSLSGTMVSSEDNSGRKGKELAQSPAKEIQEPQRKRKARADSLMEGVEEQEPKKARHSPAGVDGHQAAAQAEKKAHRGTRGGAKNRIRMMKKAKRMEITAHATGILNAQQTTPNDDIITELSQELERADTKDEWLVKLLYRDLTRLEAIHKIPGLMNNDDSESSTGAAHILAAMKLEEARAKLEGVDPLEFLEHHLLDMEDDLSHLRHKKEVLENSVRKLFKYLEHISHTTLGLDMRQRVVAVLGSLPSA